MMQLNDRGVFNVGAKFVYGRVAKLENGEALIESFSGDLKKQTYVIKDAEYSNEKPRKEARINPNPPTVPLQGRKTL